MFSLKFVVLSLGLIAASLKITHAALDEDMVEKIREALLPHVAECGKEFNIDKDSLKEAKEKGELMNLDPCFYACMFQKAEFMKDGKFDVDTAIEKSKKYVSSEEGIKKITDVGNACVSVNDEEVSDGEKGCDRAKLLVNCLAEQKKKLGL